MSRVAQIIWQAVGVIVMLVLLIGAGVWGYSMRPSDEPCERLTYRIVDADKRLYLSERELDSLLRKDDLYPVGKHLDRLRIARIEHAVRNHPMVERAECYLTPMNEVRVEIYQRVPILHVQTPIENYFVDSRHRVMPWREQIQDDVLVVTGSVGPQAATSSLAEIAEWLQTDAYWRERIQRIHMRTPQMAVILLKGDNQPQVVMGRLNGYPHKLAKLQVFLNNTAEITQVQQYRELDIRFHGQVIGRK